jgi:hypothetical protein
MILLSLPEQRIMFAAYICGRNGGRAYLFDLRPDNQIYDVGDDIATGNPSLSR